MADAEVLARIVKAYDVRGLVDTELTPEVARALGAAAAEELAAPGGRFIVGRDMRPSSPALVAAFTEGLLAAGVDVIDVGLISTDGVTYASGVMDAPGAMFTASHNPAAYNGIKLCRAGAVPVAIDSGLARIRDLAVAHLAATSADGPPTTHSGTGTDRILFAQGGITRDTTRFVNGTPVGARDIFHVDQSVGLGSGFPIFNKFSAELTRFVQLRPESQKTTRPPPVLVARVKAGHILGNCAAYDAFVLGGPHSCRGYTVGELGAARSVLEYAAELRVPVPALNTHAFAFWEACSDLGSSAEVPGNPTEYYRRAGRGVSAGAGIRLGPVRAEYATDGNQANGNWFVRFGERF